MEDRMWFGTRGNMRWVQCPERDSDMSTVGWSSQMQYLNGGAGVIASTGSHKEYLFSWNNISRAEARDITDYADGVYSTTSSDLIYFLDPTDMDTNILPAMWAYPAQGAMDGFSLVPGQNGISAPTVGFSGYPARSVTYNAATSSRSIWLPIPPGYTLWFGAHGTASGGGVQATRTAGTNDLSTVDLPLLGSDATQRVNVGFASSQSDGVRISLKNTSFVGDRVTLVGMIAQVLPTGQLPESGGFISGQGHSGCQFSEKPQVSPRYIDQVAVSAPLVETGSWL